VKTMVNKSAKIMDRYFIL